MRLPPELARAIEQEVVKVDSRELSQAADQLTQFYKLARFSSPAITTPAQRAAYLAVRLPATYAANLRVFSEIRRLIPEAAIGSVLDLGAGPGTAVHAVASVFPALRCATLVEADRSLLEMGKRLARESPHPAIRGAQWVQQDLQTRSSFAANDLAVMSYVLNEISPGATGKAIRDAWNQAREFLVIIEPGTMRGFGCIHAARTELISGGAHILAPCPHALACPMAAANDWCHFAQRVERTSTHRRLKAGVLGYEDEKFSYLIASRKPLAAAPARIVRHPQKHGGHVQLVLCTSHGLENRIVSKSQAEDYKLARKAEWGDEWE